MIKTRPHVEHDKWHPSVPPPPKEAAGGNKNTVSSVIHPVLGRAHFERYMPRVALFCK